MTGGVRLAGAAAQLVLMLAVTRLTGAFEAGLFYFGFAVLVILSSLCRLGSELSALREVAGFARRGAYGALRRCVEVRVGVTLALAVPAAAGFALLAADFVGTRVDRPHAAAVMVVLAVAVPGLALLGLLAEVLKAVDRATLAVFLQNVAVPAGAVAVLAAFAFAGQADAAAAAFAVTCSVWVALAAAVWACLCRWSQRPAAPAGEEGVIPVRQEVVQVLRDAPSLVVVASTSVIMQWIGSAVLGLLAAPEDVAGFSVAMRLAVAVAVVHSAVVSVMAPRIAAAHSAADRTGLERLSQAASVLIVVTTGPVLLLLGAVPEVWLSLFGAGLADHAAVLRILVAGQVVAAVIGHSGTVLVMTGHYAEARGTSIIAAAMLIAVSVLTVPSAGATGAAFAMAAGVAAGHLAAVWMVRRDLGFWTFPAGLAGLRLSMGGGR